MVFGMFGGGLFVNDPSGHKEVEGDTCNEKLKKSSPSKTKKCPKGKSDYRDLTDWLARALVDSAKDKRMQSIGRLNRKAFTARSAAEAAAYKLVAGKKFIGLVGNDAYYDVKWNIHNKFGDEIILGNNTYEFSTAGNILYGFYGTEASFTTVELYVGAGKAQKNDYNIYQKDPTNYPHPDHIPTLGPDGYPYYNDTEDDHEAIVAGVELHKIYEKNGKLTSKDVTTVLDKHSNLMARRPASDCQPGKNDYSTDYFYNK